MKRRLSIRIEETVIRRARQRTAEERTDDTSMALCLAETLIECEGFDSCGPDEEILEVVP